MPSSVCLRIPMYTGFYVYFVCFIKFQAMSPNILLKLIFHALGMEVAF